MDKVYFYLKGDGEVDTNVDHNKIYHSPTGFAWGYLGSGCAELALNILIMFTDETTAMRLHQSFKEDYIAGMPEKGGEIPTAEIIQWLRDNDAQIIIQSEG